MIALRNCAILAERFQKLFENRIFIGFGFQTDILQIKEYFMTANCIIGPAFKIFNRFLDLQDLFYEVQKLKNPPRLQYIVEEADRQSKCFDSELLGADLTTLCKVEQMSNWERRPLRQS